MMRILLCAAVSTFGVLVLGQPTFVPVVPEIRRLNSYRELQAWFVPSNVANKTIVVGLYTPECIEKIETVGFKGSHRQAPQRLMDLITLPAAAFPHKKCACACVVGYKKNASPTKFDFSDDLSFSVYFDWLRSLTRTELGLHNGFNKRVQLEWHEEGKEGVPVGQLEPGKSTQMTTYVSHVFAVRDMDTQEILDWTVADGEVSYRFSPESRARKCESLDESTCANTELAFTIFTHDIDHAQRLALNYLQPSVVKQVTKPGFEKRRLPPQTFERLKQWYALHEPHEELEPDVGPSMNQHVSPSYVAHLPMEEKNLFSEDMRPILEEWSNMSLRLTSVYGIRKYTDGAVLNMHVDTITTHAVSAIVNVKQDVDEDWLLEILDHDGVPHEVPMAAGDMLFYESARLLHGRPKPMKGRSYCNVFIHYMPVDGSQWDYSWF